MSILRQADSESWQNFRSIFNIVASWKHPIFFLFLFQKFYISNFLIDSALETIFCNVSLGGYKMMKFFCWSLVWLGNKLLVTLHNKKIHSHIAVTYMINRPYKQGCFVDSNLKPGEIYKDTNSKILKAVSFMNSLY